MFIPYIPSIHDDNDDDDDDAWSNFSHCPFSIVNLHVKYIWVSALFYWLEAGVMVTLIRKLFCGWKVYGFH